MFVVDTNVLLYSVNRRAREHETCRALVDRLRPDPFPWPATWSVGSILGVSTHPRVFERPLSSKTAWSFVDSPSASPSLQVLVEGPSPSRSGTEDLRRASRPLRQPGARCPHRHPHARARRPHHLHPRYRFPPLSVPRGGGSHDGVAAIPRRRPTEDRRTKNEEPPPPGFQTLHPPGTNHPPHFSFQLHFHLESVS